MFWAQTKKTTVLIGRGGGWGACWRSKRGDFGGFFFVCFFHDWLKTMVTLVCKRLVWHSFNKYLLLFVISQASGPDETVFKSTRKVLLAPVY